MKFVQKTLNSAILRTRKKVKSLSQKCRRVKIDFHAEVLLCGGLCSRR